MDQELQELLDKTVFDERLPWDEIDQHLVSIRTGVANQDEQQTDSMRLAQAFAACFELGQWDALAAFLGTLRQGETAGVLLTPARLA